MNHTLSRLVNFLLGLLTPRIPALQPIAVRTRPPLP